MRNAQCLLLTWLTAGLGVFSAEAAHASSPLEYPDNGSAQFSRGGAWLATANEPIAAHYNPAALATQGSGFSIEQQLNFNHMCYDRRGPGGQQIGPLQSEPGLVYREACSTRGSFPFTIPSISFAWRATSRLGFGFALVPPAAYGVPKGALARTSEGFDGATGTAREVPSPYRYMGLNQQSLILFPTVSVGYELFRNFRVGAGFIAGFASIKTELMSVTQLGDTNNTFDVAQQDADADLRTHDWFMPGVVASIHWSITPRIDLALWGRWVDSVRTSKGQLDLTNHVFDSRGRLAPVCSPGPTGTITNSCADAYPNPFDNAVQKFQFPISPEARIGLRYHHPRADVKPADPAVGTIRDPLHDDVFDIEVNGTYAKNTSANEIKVRLSRLSTRPESVNLPPNADRWNGFLDSYGVRLGGQWNVVRDRLGIRAGGWFESRSQEQEWINMFPMGPIRYGFGGGIVFRQDFIDISFGYQHHRSVDQDNHGNGAMRATLATGGSENQDGPNTQAKDRVDFRTPFAVNGGRTSQYANTFTLGGTVRF